MKTSGWLKALGGVALASVLVAACGSTFEPGDDGPSIKQQAHLSDCGGFDNPLSGGSDPAPASYCDAEVLHWNYDAATQRLTLSDERIELNCCGHHDMLIEQQGDVHVVTETDAPGSLGERCGCMCVFDFALEADGIAEDVIQLRIVRHVTDEMAAPEVVFEGALDLAAASGSEIIDPAPAMSCEDLLPS